MSDRRVAITGIGVVSPAGLGIEAFWQTLMQRKSCVGPVGLFDASKFPCNIAGELRDFSARDFVPKSYRKAVKVMARDIEIAVAAADLAFRDSGIVTAGIDPEKTTIDSARLGCNIGAGLICSDLDELGMAVNTSLVDGKFSLTEWGSRGMQNLQPLWLLKYLPNMLSCHVTIIHAAEAPSNTITCGDASAHMSVGEAARWIQRGDADVAIAGGAESKLNPMGLLRQGLLGRLCTSRNDRPEEACRPFDKAHEGTIIAEGGGLLVLEELSRAKARGAKIYAELVGFGAACDPAGIDVTRPTTGSLELAVAKAVKNAGISPSDIGLIVPHGTAVPAEDRAEASAWQQALGNCAAKIPAACVTAATGSAFAGHGGLTLGAAAMAMHMQTIPPTANFDSAAEGCRINLAREARKADIRYAAVGAFSIGGQSAACILKRCES